MLLDFIIVNDNNLVNDKNMAHQSSEKIIVSVTKCLDPRVYSELFCTIVSYSQKLVLKNVFFNILIIKFLLGY